MQWRSAANDRRDACAARAADEKRGIVHWLRPEFQNPAGKGTSTQVALDTGDDEETPTTMVAEKKVAWPKDLTEQVKAVASALASWATRPGDRPHSMAR